MDQWTTLNARKQFAIDLFRVLLFAEYQSATWATQRFVRRSRNVIGVRHRRRMQTGGNRPRNVRDVGKHPRADTARNLTDAREVDRAWIRRSTADEQFRTMFFGKPLQLVVVDLFRLFRHAVIRNLVTNTGKVHRMTVREVASVGQTHTENLIAILNRREIDRHVRLRATVRLHVRVIRAKQLLRAIDRRLLDDIGPLTTAVITLPGITFGVLVCEN